MNYRFCDDITLEFKAGRVVNHDMTMILDRLLAEGYVEIVPDKEYLADPSYLEQYLCVDGVRLEKMPTVAAFREAFDRLGIAYSKYWRIEDFRAAAMKYTHGAYQYRMDRKKQQIRAAKGEKEK